MKTIAYFLFALGIGLGAFAYSMDTTVEAGGQTVGSGEFAINVPKSRVHNVGLMEDRRLLFYAAGLSLVLGTAFLGIATVAGARTVTENSTRAEGKPSQHYRIDDATLAVEEQFAEAIRSSDLATVKHLLSNRSISPHGRNRNGKGWLQYATVIGSTNAAKTLLEHGASPKDKDDLGRSALEEAETQSNGELISLFVEQINATQRHSAA